MFEKPKILPPVYFFAAILCMAGLHVWLPIRIVLPSPLNYAGLPLLLAGLGMTLWAAARFSVAGTPVKPFERSTTLVTGGVYRFTRNPMYLGLIGTLLGIAILFGTLSPLVVVPPFVWLLHNRFVLREERFLEDIFGQEYLSYKTKVRRWL